jgi:hypothetical protein
MRALGKPRQKMEVLLHPRSAAPGIGTGYSETAVHPYFGFCLVGDDDGDDEPPRSLRQRLKMI